MLRSRRCRCRCLQDVVGKSARTIFGNPPVVFHIAVAFFSPLFFDQFMPTGREREGEMLREGKR